MANYSKLKPKDCVTICGLVCADHVGLEKWPRVVDKIVTLAADVLKIKRLFHGTNPDFAEGVLQSLYIWLSYGPEKQEDLLKVLKDLGLNKLAAEISEQVIEPSQKSAKAAPVSSSEVLREINSTSGHDSEKSTQVAGPNYQLIPAPTTTLRTVSIKYFPVNGFSQATIDSIIDHILLGDNWCLDVDDTNDFNIALVNLAREFDLSQIISYVVYKIQRIQPRSSVFNSCGQWIVLAKIAENANADELKGAIDKAKWQWQSIEAVLNHALEKGVKYCSLLRGWDQSTQTGEAQGDQIIKIVTRNPALNNEIKANIFKIISGEALKTERSLYRITGLYLSYDSVKVANQKHDNFLREELHFLRYRFQRGKDVQECEHKGPNN